MLSLCTGFARNACGASSQRLSARGMASGGYGNLVQLTMGGDGVAKVVLNNPDKLNMLTEQMGDEFVAVCNELRNGEHSRTLRSVVVTGEGRAFSSGGDLDFLEARTQSDAMTNAEVMLRFYRRFLAVRTIPVPVIAAINGPAIGAGLCFAMACDLRIASPDAKMGLTFVSIGLHPGMAGSYMLPKLVGPQQAARLILTGDVIKGSEAASIGLVAECAEDCVGRAEQLARRIAQGSPQAVRMVTRTLRAEVDRGLEQGLNAEADAQAHNYASLDMQEGLQALRRKEAPQFLNVYPPHSSE